MFKLVLADDERFILRELKKLLDWKSLGFEIVGEFLDGREVLEYIKRHPVDVVLSDIRMKYVSGIEIAQYVAEHHLDIKVILVSGYQEFEYARQAIIYKVEEYLTKPTSYQDLYCCFKKIRDQLEQERRKNQEDCRQVLLDMVTGGYRSEEELEKSLRSAGIDLSSHRRYCLIGIQWENLEQYLSQKYFYGKNGFFTTLENILSFCSGDICFYILRHSSKESLLLAMGEKEKFTAKAFHDGLDCFSREMQDVLDVKPNCMAGNVVEDVEHLVTEYFMRFSDRGKIETGLLESIQYHVKEHDNARAANIAAMVMDYLTELHEIRRFAGRVLECLDLEKPKNLEKMNREQLKQFLLQTLYRIQSSGTESALKQAIQYIQQNYQKDIFLDEVAEYVGLNPAYFSRMFKKETGERFIDYLMNVRIRHAMELLTGSERKAYEIGEMVGYRNVQHFYKTFKAVTGETPLEYRSKHKMREEEK